jgi:hypothetical protein
MAITIVTLTAGFLKCLHGAVGSFRDRLSGNWGSDWPLAFLPDEIQLGLARYRLLLANPWRVQSVSRLIRGQGHLERFRRTFQKLNRIHRFHTPRGHYHNNQMRALWGVYPYKD